VRRENIARTISWTPVPTRDPRPLRPVPLLLAVAAATATLARADEGMWTFDAFPAEKVQRAYGFAPDAAWLDHVRLASARLAGGCSASFVSPDGLVVTNHHCASACVEQLSTPGADLVRAGFQARTRAEERRCPDEEVDQLVSIADVTARVRGATRGREGAAFQRALRGEIAALEKACQTSAAVRCDVVTLYQGGLYHLYTYRRFTDVRLVFAPELAIAFFGGDPDNFEFPRYDLDVAFLRVYEGGKPARTPEWFRWSPAGAAEGELTFVTGHPGGTDRALTVAELRHQRDVALPDRLVRLAELRGLLTGFQLLGAEQRRISTDELFGIENAFKAVRGQLLALGDPVFFDAKVAAERALAAEAAKEPERGARVRAALADIDRAEERLRGLRRELTALEHPGGGTLLAVARQLLRAGDERSKPDGDRLREYREASLPALSRHVLSDAPIHPELERLLLAHALSKLREDLGPDHPVVRRVLGKASPDEVAARAISGTRLADPAVRRRLWEGGRVAVETSGDPLIGVARALDPEARAIRRAYEDEVEAPVRRGHEVIADARFAVQGRTTYPDATFTLRLTYGQVKGWREGTRDIAPFTTLAGAFERATGREPFALPRSWLDAKDRLGLATPFDLATTNDIVGGNSGSPLVNARAELVGVIFDGNIHSLGGEYGFDPANNRAVAVDSRAVVETLGKVYGARGLLEELGVGEAGREPRGAGDKSRAR
jgi:hypothetical protein